MKTPTLLLSLVAISALTASAQVKIVILNPLFNRDQLTCTAGCCCFANDISGWLCGPEVGLGDTLQANTTYALKIRIGARADYPFTGYSAGLVAGNITVASGNNATPVGGSFVIDEIAYSSGTNPAQLGKPLQIFVKSLGTGQIAIAAVTLTATPN